MKLEQLYTATVKLLRETGHEFAVCGGVAAMVYRAEIRYTGDIDFLIDAESSGVEIASTIITGFGLKPFPMRSAELSMAPMSNKKQSPVEVVIGRNEADKAAIGIDFLFPIQPWTKNALRRAKMNLITLHGTEAPFVTSEDIILAKLTAIGRSGGRREKDWSDVESIVASGRPLDFPYLAAEISRLNLHIPKHLEKQLPKELATTLKRIRTQLVKSRP